MGRHHSSKFLCGVGVALGRLHSWERFVLRLLLFQFAPFSLHFWKTGSLKLHNSALERIDGESEEENERADGGLGQWPLVVTF